MKNEILKVLAKHDQDPHGVDMSNTRRINADAAADDLTALMCYREVKGIVFVMPLNIKYIDNYVGYFIQWIGKDYPEQTIREAIEKVKNEQK